MHAHEHYLSMCILRSLWCDQIWQNLSGKNFQSLAICWGLILHLAIFWSYHFGNNLMLLGEYSLLWISKCWKNNLAIWSHCLHYRPWTVASTSSISIILLLYFPIVKIHLNPRLFRGICYIHWLFYIVSFNWFAVVVVSVLAFYSDDSSSYDSFFCEICVWKERTKNKQRPELGQSKKYHSIEIIGLPHSVLMIWNLFHFRWNITYGDSNPGWHQGCLWRSTQDHWAIQPHVTKLSLF